MARIYDNIQTAKDLVHEVMAHGLSTKMEDICRVQDIFGHSTIEELVELANDIGRNDANGNPDPKGTWSSGRRGTRDTFYTVLFKIWNYEDATSFWNMYTNPEHEKYQETLSAYEVVKSNFEYMNEECKTEHKARLAETSAKLEAEEKVRKLEAELHDRDMTIMELKAKLYDQMMKG